MDNLWRQSARNDSIGSVLVARNAGRKLDTAAMLMSTSGAIDKTRGSRALTSNMKASSVLLSESRHHTRS